MAPSSGTPTNIPNRSLNNQVILEEDEYTTALSHIIARDFFPSLAQLDATNGYLDALRSGDPNLIDATVRRLEQVNTPYIDSRRMPSQTPLAHEPSDTPYLQTPQGEPSNKRPRYDTSLRLDAFQAKYTSEDNSSFTQILEDENKKRRERSAWAWDAQRRVESQRERMIEQREKMLLEAPPAAGVREKMRIEQPTPPRMITDEMEKDKGGDEGEGQELVVKGKEKDGGEEQVIDIMAPTKDTRPAGVDGWKFKARNSLMFTPDVDVSPYQPQVSKPGQETDPKVIKYANTRLSEQDVSTPGASLSAPPSPTRSRIGAAIAGAPYHPSQASQGHTLVPNVPSPTPSELGPKAVQQLMTWGTLNATPRIISQGEDVPSPQTPFHIPAPTAREALGHKLSSTASRSLRAKASLLGIKTPGIFGTPVSSGGYKNNMGPPSWTPKRADAIGNLTPAARRLLERSTLGTAGSRRAAAMERTTAWDGSSQKKDALSQTRWTPTPHSQSRR
ncbi:hypothetical protein AX16_009601 [Volvariella volvacea WC 439]|nr:hypothetical protein AX16_009601 [Volvariella volvacea WC 439]